VFLLFGAYGIGMVSTVATYGIGPLVQRAWRLTGPRQWAVVGPTRPSLVVWCETEARACVNSRACSSRWERALKELNGRPATELAEATARTAAVPDDAYTSLLACIGTMPSSRPTVVELSPAGKMSGAVEEADQADVATDAAPVAGSTAELVAVWRAERRAGIKLVRRRPPPQGPR
jgi:hypothetical protein